MTTAVPASWPRVEATLTDDGMANVSIGGVRHTLSAASIQDVRPRVVQLIASRAAQLGRPLRAFTYEPNAQMVLIIDSDGKVSVDPTTQPKAAPSTEQTSVVAALVSTEPSRAAEVTEARPRETVATVHPLKPARALVESPAEPAEQAPAQRVVRPPAQSPVEQPEKPEPQLSPVEPAVRHPVERQPIEPTVQHPVAPQPVDQPQPKGQQTSHQPMAEPVVAQPTMRQTSEQVAEQRLAEPISPRAATSPQEHPTHLETPAGAGALAAARLESRHSFLTHYLAEEPATQGWRGLLARLGFRVMPSAEEMAEREDIKTVAQRWVGPRTIAIVNSKGGAGKTPTTALLSAVFARFGGAGVLAWDNNQTRGTLGWRTEQGPHDATIVDLLPQAQHLLNPGAQAADLARFMHHQTRDRFDVLRSKPTSMAQDARLQAQHIDSIHAVASKYYRLLFVDSGNDESDPLWLRMMDYTDQIVVATTTRDDHAEAGALLLEALARRDAHSANLARNAVAVVSQADPNATAPDVERIASGYRSFAREVATIPFDPAMVDGVLSYGTLRRRTQRAWLAAAAAVARGL